MNYLLISFPLIIKTVAYIYSRRNISNYTKKIFIENIVFFLVSIGFAILNWNYLKGEFFINKINIGTLLLTIWIFSFFYIFCVSLVSGFCQEIIKITPSRNFIIFDIFENIFLIEIFIFYKLLYFENDLLILILLILYKAILSVIDIILTCRQHLYYLVVSIIECLFSIMFYIASYSLIWTGIFVLVLLLIPNYKVLLKKVVRK